MSSCAYPSILGQVYEATHWLVWLVPLAVSAASIGKDRNGKWGKQIYIFMFGCFLTIMQGVLFLFQNLFNTLRADPYCVDVYSNAFPSAEAFYVSSLITFIASTTYFWNIVLSWSYWTISILFIIAPCGTLIWFQYNTLWEILISIGFGVITTVFFVVLVRFMWKPYIPFMLQVAPFTWMNCIDSYIMSEDEIQESIRVEVVLKAVEKGGNELI